MTSQPTAVEWEEIHGFDSPGEYQRFLRYIEHQMAAGAVRELPASPLYEKGMIYGGRWFQGVDSIVVWRRVPPDFPFRGLWEPVVPEIRE